jgi:hypothetical protein
MLTWGRIPISISALMSPCDKPRNPLPLKGSTKGIRFIRLSSDT